MEKEKKSFYLSEILNEKLKYFYEKNKEIPKNCLVGKGVFQLFIDEYKFEEDHKELLQKRGISEYRSAYGDIKIINSNLDKAFYFFD